MFDAPRLAKTTKKNEPILLDIPTPADIPAIVEYLNDAEVMAELDPSWKETTIEQELLQLRQLEESQDTVMYYVRVAGRCVGAAWINEIDREKRTGSFGIMIGDKASWGKGIASNVAEAISEYAFTEAGLDSLHVSLTEANAGSRKVALRAGYELTEGMARFVGGESYKGWEGVLTKSGWLAAHTDKSK